MSKGNIVITGVSSGIGEVLTDKFISEGYHVFGSVRRQEDAKRLLDRYENGFTPMIFDVTDEAAIRKTIRDHRERLDQEGLLCLINNAGIAVIGPVEHLSVEQYRKQFEVNFFGLIATTQFFLPFLKPDQQRNRQAGKIINISSVASVDCIPFMSPYSCSKAAVDNLTTGLRRELSCIGVDVVSINPGPIESAIWEKVEEMDKELEGTPYLKPMNRFYEIARKGAANAIKGEDFAAMVFKVFLSKKPPTRWVIVQDKFFKHVLPRLLLSKRGYDRAVQKVLRFNSAKQ